MSGTVLVIGATGILAPAAATLVARGGSVVGVSRHGGTGTRGVDARDPEALRAALAEISFDRALVYEPAVTPESLDAVRAQTWGPVVVVRTSAAADPTHGTLALSPDTVQLGWTEAAPHRWHTPAEVSEAALAVLSDGTSRVLGTVRPWSDKP